MSYSNKFVDKTIYFQKKNQLYKIMWTKRPLIYNISASTIIYLYFKIYIMAEP